MHHVTQAVEASSSTPAGYAARSQGFRRATYVDHPTGSVHMGVGLCTLEPNGWIQPHLHSFEESFIVLEGSLVAQLGEAAIEGARANGLEHKVGTLTPGKQADVILLRTDRVNVMPINDPIGAVVWGMDTSNVDTMFVAGKPLKRDGQLVNVDLRAVKKMVTESRDYVVRKSRFRLPAI